MSYKVIHRFRDLQDKDYIYSAGDMFPRKGVKVLNKRIAELAGSENEIGIPLIEEVKEPKKPENMTVAELKAFLKEHEIKFTSKTKQAELLELAKGIGA